MRTPSARASVGVLAGLVAGVAATVALHAWADRKAARRHEGQRLSDEEQIATALGAHSLESRDSTWAEQTERTFTADIGSRIKDIQSLNIDCRATMCVARIAFNTCAGARENWKDILLGKSPLKCAISVNTVDSDRGANCAVQVILMCPARNVDDGG